MQLKRMANVTLRITSFTQLMGIPGGSDGKKLPANAGGIRDVGSISGLGRCPGEGSSNPF